MITQQKVVKKEYSSGSLVKIDTSTYLAKKFNRQKLWLKENQSPMIVFKVHHVISRQMSTKIFMKGAKMCEIQFFSALFFLFLPYVHRRTGQALVRRKIVFCFKQNKIDKKIV